MPKIVNHIDLMQDRAWAIRPEKLQEIQILIDRKISGESIDFPSAEKGKSGNKADEPYLVENGLAIIPVYSTIFKKANLLTEMSGATSTELLRDQIGAAIRDKKVDAILLDIDSPGGTVDGTKELADFIYANRGKKPIYAFANGLMASAALWIGTAAEKVFTTETSLVGSIGVAMTHYDLSERDKSAGIKRTVISAGKYKRIASDEKPLSPEGQDYLQANVDYYYSLFVDGVARHRGVSAEVVLSTMADGRDFIGAQAVAVGLVDQIGTFEMAKKITLRRGVQRMDLRTLKADHPDLYQSVFDAGVNSVEKPDTAALKASAELAGTTAERERVVGILKIAGADLESKTVAIEQGCSVDAAKGIFWDRDQVRRSQALEGIKNSAGTAVTVDTNAGKENREKDAATPDYVELVKSRMADAKCTQTEAQIWVLQNHPKVANAFAAGKGGN